MKPQALRYLYRIVEAGEKGYAVAAANMDNLGVKLLFKSYAQQRARFKAEILSELGEPEPRSSLRGVIHRGRIDIFAALSAGKAERERVVLKEVALGEGVALRAYQQTLKAELPPATRQILERQSAQIGQINERVQQLRGKGGQHLIVQLFDTQKEAALALTMLEDNGQEFEKVEIVSVNTSLDQYEGRSHTVQEASLSGAVGGALWGGLIGALAATSSESATQLVSFGTIPSPGIWWLIALAGVMGGGLIGLAIGYAIGLGIRQEDVFLSELSRQKQEQVLVLTLVEVARATEVQRMLNLIKLNPSAQMKETIV